jgi:hypothetical protein
MVTNLPPPVPRKINRKPELIVNTLEEARFLGYALLRKQAVALTLAKT